MLLALLIAWLQMRFHLIPLAGGSFLISYFPVKLRLMDFLLVGATVFVIALIASWLPSKKLPPMNFRCGANNRPKIKLHLKELSKTINYF